MHGTLCIRHWAKAGGQETELRVQNFFQGVIFFFKCLILFGNFCDPELQGSRSPLLQPLFVAASDLQDLVVAVRESRHTRVTIFTTIIKF